MDSDEQNQIERQVARIVASATFKRKPMVTTLFNYVVAKTLAGEIKDLTERAIAKKVFGETFPPEGDKPSTVRVHAGNLRAALQEYYQQDGQQDELTILVPKGAYVATFLPRETSGTVNSRKRSVVLIEAQFDVFENLMNLEPALQKLAGDPTLRIVQLRIGSIFVELDSSVDGYRALLILFENGVLALVLGHPVEAILPAAIYYHAFETSRRTELQTCFSPIMFFSSAIRPDYEVVALLSLSDSLATSDDSVLIDVFVSGRGVKWGLSHSLAIKVKHLLPNIPSPIAYDSEWAREDIDNMFFRFAFRLEGGATRDPSSLTVSFFPVGRDLLVQSVDTNPPYVNSKYADSGFLLIKPFSVESLASGVQDPATPGLRMGGDADEETGAPLIT